MKTRKSIYLIYVSFVFILLPLQYGCDNDINVQKSNDVQTKSVMAPSSNDIFDNSENEITIFIKNLQDKGISDEEIELKLVEFINTQQNNKATNYTYTVSGIKIGCWMLLSKSTTDRAHWGNSWIYEPITNIWKDKASTDLYSALSRVTNHLQARGFNLSSVHTWSYYGYINGTYKFNTNNTQTWSDKNTIYDNNHGRIFGPVKVGDYWVTIGAFSRETGVTHNFINFYQARDKAAGTSTYFPTASTSYYSGNTWEDDYNSVKVLTKN